MPLLLSGALQQSCLTDLFLHLQRVAWRAGTLSGVRGREPGRPCLGQGAWLGAVFP